MEGPKSYGEHGQDIQPPTTGVLCAEWSVLPSVHEMELENRPASRKWVLTVCHHQTPDPCLFRSSAD